MRQDVCYICVQIFPLSVDVSGFFPFYACENSCSEKCGSLRMVLGVFRSENKDFIEIWSASSVHFSTVLVVFVISACSFLSVVE